MNIKESLIALAIIIPGLIAFAVGLSALFAVPVFYLWNGVVIAVFGLTKISFLQAWGLSFLSRLMFGSHNISAK